MTQHMFLDNILLLTDSYKVSHFNMYPPKTKYVFSYLESRGGMFDNTVFFGLQYFIKEYLTGKVVTKEKIDEAESYLVPHGFKFNREGWEYILNEYDGHLPIVIDAVPEGTVVSTQNVLMTVFNTDQKCFWLTNYLETLLLECWYPITVATLSREMKKKIKAAIDKTSDDPENAGLLFKLHDFGHRGCSSPESSAIGGAAHLVNFLGTDTLPALVMTKKYYNGGAAFSIPASEHSNITSWGEKHECDAFENLLDKNPTGLVACVSDSFNIYRAVEEYWGTRLRDKVMGRDGTLVIRPDSGHAPTVLPELLNIAWEKFGGHVNQKGYKVLTEKVRFIWGDGIEYDSIDGILDAIMDAGFAVENCAFGMGGALLQKVNRDTQKFAFKCSAINIDGEWQDVFKRPIHDAFKTSKKGLLGLFINDKHEFETRPRKTQKDKDDNLLQRVFDNGRLVRDEKFDVIRERAKL